MTDRETGQIGVVGTSVAVVLIAKYDAVKN